MVSHHHGRFHSAPHRPELFGGQVDASFYSRNKKCAKLYFIKATGHGVHPVFNKCSEYGDYVELLKILVTSSSAISKPMREREEEREGGEREREEGKEEREERVALTWMVSNRHTLSPG